MPEASITRLRNAASAARNRAQFALGQVGFVHSSSRMTDDASRYWYGELGDPLQNDSHWHSGSKSEGTESWRSMGEEQLRLYQRLRQTSSDPEPLKRIVDWGCGGGANAVAFAPLAAELIIVDVNLESVDECARQLAMAGPTPFVKVQADMARPEQADAGIAGLCDLFLCLYVLELVPTQEYGLRLMSIAHNLLRQGGQGFVQIKYSTGAWRTRPRRRSYRSDIAGNTYRVEDFRTAMVNLGFRPETVTLVPKNDLDERYAYFLLSKP